jgi:Spy/CpxP family protein refolding chaperone
MRTNGRETGACRRSAGRGATAALITASIVAMSLLAVGGAQAQRRGGFGMMGRGGGFGLLSRPEVQTELKLSDAQKTQISDLADKQREAARDRFQDLRDASPEEREKAMMEWNAQQTKQINGVLNADQQKRFRQISLQQQGPMALTDPTVAEELKLTADQKSKVKEIMQQQREAQREIFESAGPDRDAAREKMQALRKTTNDKLAGVLTADQKRKWTEMQGTPFTLAPVGA